MTKVCTCDLVGTIFIDETGMNNFNLTDALNNNQVKYIVTGLNVTVTIYVGRDFSGLRYVIGPSLQVDLQQLTLAANQVPGAANANLGTSNLGKDLTGGRRLGSSWSERSLSSVPAESTFLDLLDSSGSEANLGKTHVKTKKVEIIKTPSLYPNKPGKVVQIPTARPSREWKNKEAMQALIDADIDGVDDYDEENVNKIAAEETVEEVANKSEVAEPRLNSAAEISKIKAEEAAEEEAAESETAEPLLVNKNEAKKSLVREAIVSAQAEKAEKAEPILDDQVGTTAAIPRGSVAAGNSHVMVEAAKKITSKAKARVRNDDDQVASLQPSPEPTYEPILWPTPEPTPLESSSAEKSPTIEPSPSLTLEPSLEPSSVPKREPVGPTFEPSPSPSFTEDFKIQPVVKAVVFDVNAKMQEKVSIVQDDDKADDDNLSSKKKWADKLGSVTVMSWKPCEGKKIEFESMCPDIQTVQPVPRPTASPSTLPTLAPTYTGER